LFILGCYLHVEQLWDEQPEQFEPPELDTLFEPLLKPNTLIFLLTRLEPHSGQFTLSFGPRTRSSNSALHFGHKNS
jgi:hypothetical protein